ncbi:unknown protein (plasmid) [Nostoc sp. NIES-3756]|uniref:hypothetical protein n=1 Tax=unclassified Nostoc TaxID=2593658 RepID=UPI000722824E|nr:MULTISPECIES: hypothetical protein [unclassified Nostoc]BAT56863.1 unknown protein [Nostoc sp. NIES-3756]
MEEDITVEEAIELLFNRESIQAAIRAEDEAACDVSAGLDWGNNRVFVAFMKNPALLHRMTILRLSLNREIRQMLQGWNLGVGEEKAIETAYTRLLSQLQLPQQKAIPLLEKILMRDDLYSEELIGDRQVLQELLSVLYSNEDWDVIATVAGNAVREGVLVNVETSRLIA